MATSLSFISGDGSDPRWVSPAAPHGTGLSVETTLLGQIEEMARAANAGDNFQAVIEGVATAIARTSPWPMCGVEVFDVERQQSVTWASAGFHPSAEEVFKQWPAESDPPLTAARNNRIVAIPDVSRADEYPHTRKLAIRTGFRSAIYVPIRLADHWAVLTLCRPEIHEYTPDELALAGSMASLAAIALGPAMKLYGRHRVFGADGAQSRGELEVRVAAQDRLLRVQISGAGLNEFCQVVADLLGAPVMLVDRFQQQLGVAGLGQDQAAGLADHLSEAKPGRQGEDGFVWAHCGRRRVVVAPCGEGASRLGSLLVLPPPGEDLPAAMAGTVELACQHLALALRRQRSAIEAEVRMRQDFGSALGSMTTTSLPLAQLAGVLGIELNAPLRVMRARPAGLRPPLSSYDGYEVAELLGKRLAQVGVSAVVSPVGGIDFVLVLRERERGRGEITPAQVVRNGLRDALVALQGAIAAEVSVTIGTGGAAVGVDGLDRSHREAHRALEVARLMDGEDADRDIADVGSYAVLTAGSTAAQTDQFLFVRRYLEPLMEYDRLHNAGYIETLETYFENVGNIQRTADKLYLHLSTVRYRLKRVEEIAHIDLRNEEDRLCLQLALRFVRLRSDPGEIR